jgi:parallel beta-helix repeat protein
MVDAGLRMGNSHNNIISNNIFRDIRNTGMLLHESNHTISDNIIIDSAQGIWLNGDPDSVSNLTISNNTIADIGYEGILLWCAHGNTITGNNITNARQGVVILESHNNLIKRNNIAHNSQGVFLSLSRRNKFYENNFIDSGYAGHVEFKGYSFFNRWRGNYWDNQIIHGVPKILFGRFGILPIPWFNFDWRPAKKPYDISSQFKLPELR